MSLLDSSRSILVVIDIQGKLVQQVHRPELVLEASRRHWCFFIGPPFISASFIFYVLSNSSALAFSTEPPHGLVLGFGVTHHLSSCATENDAEALSTSAFRI